LLTGWVLGALLLAYWVLGICLHLTGLHHLRLHLLLHGHLLLHWHLSLLLSWHLLLHGHLHLLLSGHLLLHVHLHLLLSGHLLLYGHLHLLLSRRRHNTEGLLRHHILLSCQWMNKNLSDQGSSSAKFIPSIVLELDTEAIVMFENTSCVGWWHDTSLQL